MSGDADADVTPGPVEIAVDGQEQRFDLDPPTSGNTRKLEEVAAELNWKLRGVSVRLEGVKLTIATDRAGTAASLEVIAAPAELKLPTTKASHAWHKDNNNVADLGDLTVADLRLVFGDEVSPSAGDPTLKIDEVAQDGQRKLVLTTARAGTDPAVTLTVDGGTAADALGLATGQWKEEKAGGAGSFTVKVKENPAANEHSQFPGGTQKAFAVSLTIPRSTPTATPDSTTTSASIVATRASSATCCRRNPPARPRRSRTYTS